MTSHDSSAEVHVASYGSYVKVWVALLVLTGVTVGAAMTNLKQMAIFTALLVATVKSSLVLLYFMHLRYENKLFAYMFIAVIATFVIFLGLTFADYSFRGY
jgi:cytochrome c oxidase subunit 4